MFFSTDVVVETTGGNADGDPCVFPFIFQGNTFYGCITQKARYLPWCGTTANYDADRKWGNCVVSEYGLS